MEAKPRLLYLNKYSINGGSSRVRSYQFKHYIEQGFDIEYLPLFSEKYLAQKYAGKRTLIEVIKAYSRRFINLWKIRSVDLVWVEKEAFPYLPFFFESLVFALAKKVIVEYDDAIFHNYDSHRSSIIRVLLGKKIDRVMSRASCIIVGNEYLEDRAREARAHEIFIVPSVVSMKKYKVLDELRESEFPVIGWIGTPMTQKYLNVIEIVLDELFLEIPFKLHLIGVNEGFWSEKPYIVSVPWSDSTEVEELQKFDIGIMPLLDDRFERGKCGFKLIQYMACGKPVLGSPVAINKTIIQNGYNGYLCGSLEEWKCYLRLLLENGRVRSEMGRNSRADFEKNYSVEKWGPRLLEIGLKTVREEL